MTALPNSNDVVQHQQVPAGRVVQLDARTLDRTLIDLFRAQLYPIAANCLPEYTGPSASGWPEWLQNNLEQLLELLAPLAFRAVQAVTGQSPGQRLMNIRFSNDSFNRRKGLLLFLLGTLLPKTFDFLLDSLPRTSLRLLRLLDRIGLALKLADLLYFFHFLGRGGPPKLVEKLLRVESVYADRPSFGQLNFDALNREQFGHAFVQLVILLAPLLAMARQRLDKLIRHKGMAKSNGIGKPGGPKAAYICVECSQKAICAVRARRKGKRGEEDWAIYCFLCLANDDSSASTLQTIDVGEPYKA